MAGTGHHETASVVREIKQKSRQLALIVILVVVVLLSLVAGSLLRPEGFSPGSFPGVWLVVLIGGIVLLTSIAIYRAIVLSQQSVRIIEDYSGRLERLLNITKDLREEVYGDILLEKVMDYALAMTQSDAGSILLKDGGNLTFKIVRGEKSEKLLGASLETSKGITGWVARYGKPLRIADVSQDARFNAGFDAMTGYRTRSILCVPLKTKEGVVGVLELLNKRSGHPYRQRDEDIIAYLADQAAISIMKARLFEDQRNFEIHLTEILLGAIDYQIPEKQGHARRVAHFSNLIARSLNFSEDRQKRLYFASLLHDVGFLKLRSGELYVREDFMRHASIGYEMIKPITFYSDIAPFIFHHHERYDGHGYPSGLKGEEIPLEARIIAVAEAFDVMTSTVSYKIPVGFEKAVAELDRTAGSQFDPALVSVFTEAVAAERTK